MSCDRCSLPVGRFRSHDHYREVKRTINDLVNQGILREGGLENPNSPFLVVRYTCRECGQSWLVTSPDQNFLGGIEAARD
ncbi:hypothetical protein FHS01_003873 [Longimicrobium terrae]|uniref:Uncharacterized protein n=1 Tax=Longimicrobium terrae TaxID=1639882 RepID=A0A841H2L4_9BACT|nr:hypothetical protein [Longimicrobium terrae]MBB6072331.1 hypothetical protein [Longimicrobium terrae]